MASITTQRRRCYLTDVWLLNLHSAERSKNTHGMWWYYQGVRYKIARCRFIDGTTNYSNVQSVRESQPPGLNRRFVGLALAREISIIHCQEKTLFSNWNFFKFLPDHEVHRNQSLPYSTKSKNVHKFSVTSFERGNSDEYLCR